MVPNAGPLFIISIVSFASNWQFGYQITYINTAAPDFYAFANDAYQRNSWQGFGNSTSQATYLPYEKWSQQWSLIVSSFYPGTFLGFVLVPFLIRRVGVKKSLIFSAYPAVLGCFIQLFVQLSSSGNLLVLNLILGRFLASTEKHRPFLSSLQQVSQALSTLIGLLVGSESIIPLGALKIQWLQILGIVPICVFIVVLVLLPDTPLHLLEDSKKREKPIDFNLKNEIIKSATFYYGDPLELSIKDNDFGKWDNMENPEFDNLATFENLKGLLIGSLAAISFSFTADDIIDSYSSQLLYKSVGTGSYAQAITVFLGAWLLIASIFGAFIVDRFGRKRVLIFGLIGTAFSNLVAALGSAKGSVVVVTIGFAFTKTFIGVGAGAPAWFLTSELVSPGAICICQSISTGSLLITTGFITLLFLPLQQVIGGSYSILILASVPAFVVALLLIIFLPEPKIKVTTKFATNYKQSVLRSLFWPISIQ
uniref:Major facilitator superfamily (MFS) profile domain-containing protein n=1 Tax=Ditylenchus dipsaci TaxID=166011 RepID=A0A915DDZ4_9BILA